jgi:hypothetical protein
LALADGEIPEELTGSGIQLSIRAEFDQTAARFSALIAASIVTAYPDTEQRSRISRVTITGMHQDIIRALARKHPLLNFAVPSGLYCGLGWIGLVDELMDDLGSIHTHPSICIRSIRGDSGALEVQATWDTSDPNMLAVPHMLAAISRRSSLTCQICGGTASTLTPGLCSCCRLASA